MKSHEEISDSEINIAVAKVIFVGAYSFITPYKHRPDAEVIKHNVGGDVSFCVDYCNNPSDAWPIIVENKITVFSPNCTHDDGLWMAEIDDWHSFCANPLRAAMIVYLMMQDDSK